MTTNLLSVIEQQHKALERMHLWADSQADAQSKGGHATFDLMRLREERDAMIPALAAGKQALEQTQVGINGLTYEETSETMSVMGLSKPAPSTAGELEGNVVSLPVPASASDLKSDIAELIQSHKYKGLRSIEVLGVFQFLGADIISGSNT